MQIRPPVSHTITVMLHALDQIESALVKLQRNSYSLQQDLMPIFLGAYISSFVDLYSESSPGVIQVIIKYDKRCFLFDEISTKDTRCSDLFPPVQARLGFPGHARLIENGRILRMGKTLEQVRQGMTAKTKV